MHYDYFMNSLSVEVVRCNCGEYIFNPIGQMKTIHCATRFGTMTNDKIYEAR